MADGKKNAGRKKGSLNKKTIALAKKLDDLGCDPIEGMVKLLNDKKKYIGVELEFAIYKELAGYLYAKRRAVEVSGDPDNPLSFEMVEPKTPQERKEMIAEYLKSLPEDEIKQIIEGDPPDEDG